MNLISAPLILSDRGEAVTNLQEAMQLLLDRGIIQASEEDRRFMEDLLRRERQDSMYGDGTARVVTLFRAQHRLEPGEVVDEPTAKAMNALLRELGVLSSITVQGRLVSATNTGLAGYTVVLSDYDLEGTTEIGSQTSNSNGAFEFVFDNSDSLRQGDGDTAPDLNFRVLDAAGAEQFVRSISIFQGDQTSDVPRLAQSERAPIVLMNIAGDLTVRIVVAPSQGTVTEFERLVEQLTPFMGQVGFADLKEDEDHFQISFLCQETGLEQAKIEQLRDAFGQERDSEGVPAWAFFGLASAGLDLVGVTVMPLEALSSSLKPLRPASDASDLEEVARKLQSYLLHRRVQTGVADLRASLGETLQPHFESDVQLGNFFEAHLRHEGDTESFWRKIADTPDLGPSVPGVQLSLQLSQLTLNNVTLVRALLERGIESTRQLVDLPGETWEALALEHKDGIPAHVAGENDEARARVYAGELQTLVELAFPTPVIRKTLQDADSAAFLDRNPEFDFTRTPLETYLLGRGTAALEGLQNPVEARASIGRMQRLYTLTGNASDMQTLAGAGFESANQVARHAAEDFAREFEGKIPLDQALAYHAKAVAVSESAALIYHQLRDLTVSPGVYAAPSAGGDPGLAKIIPNWESLFGSISTCECEHCKSVYSPAAYFVDLLHVLLDQSAGAARKELFRRRPDLMYTKLSCEHTETLIPYIDLVNEVLETYVARSDVGNPAAASHAKVATNDTSAFTADELAANPQHPNPNAAQDAEQAHALLREATYPLALPFDLDLETARQFLVEQGGSRHEVMRTFGEAGSNATLAESLGLSAREFEILTLTRLDGLTPAGIDLVKDLWGDPAIPIGQTLGSVLAGVNTLLERTALTYAELVALLGTRFLNPHFPINEYLQSLPTADRSAWLAAHPDEGLLVQGVIELGADPGDPCNLTKTRLLHLDGSALSDDELSRLNRLVRLWRKLGCTAGELDGLLEALGASDLTPQVMRHLAALWQARQRLQLPLERVATLMGNIPSAAKDSLFARLFLNKAILQLDAKFALNLDRTELVDPTQHLSDHLPAVLAAFNVTEQDLGHVAAYAGMDLSVQPLTLANLSRLYRYVVLAKGLRISVSDLVTWLELAAPPPMDTAGGLLETLDLLEKLQRYGFKASDFNYLFGNASATGQALPPDEEVIIQSAKTLREGLQKITQETAPPDGPVTVDFLKARLGSFLEPDEVGRVTGILDGSNMRDPFSDLLSLKVADPYEPIFSSSLTPAEVAGLAATSSVPQRLKDYWGLLAPRLVPALRETFVQQHLIAAFKAEAATVALVLRDGATLPICLDIEIDTPVHAQSYAELYVALHKFTWLTGRLKLLGKELVHFTDNTRFGNFRWNTPDFKLWLRLADYADLRDSLPASDHDWLSVFESAASGGDVPSAIVAVTRWDEADVKHFVNQRPRADFLNEIAPAELKRRLGVGGRVGVSLEKLEPWATEVVTSEQAQDIKRTLKAKYDETAWIEVSARVHNRLRVGLRDALAAYLLQKPEIRALGLKNTNDLYGYFLIDLEMDACMLTSRLKQAIASVQLFVQRCLLNLETPAVSPQLVNSEWWKWMKNYRVWEANRKVFLYPENWIEPELRDNKSPFFKELESELLQDELTDVTAEQKLMHYLEKLDEVARLDICGIYQDEEAQECHVFGRTFNAPPQYFYRKLNLITQVWTAWERIPLDIQGNEEGDSAGVHLIPVVWNRRLYLFWPVFTKKSDQQQIQQDKQAYKLWKRSHDQWLTDIANLRKEKENLRNSPEHLGNTKSEADFGPEPIEPVMESFPNEYYEVKMAWSEYRRGSWSNKHVSQSYIRTPNDRYEVALTSYYRFALERGSTLKIRLYYQPSMAFLMGEYELGCNGRMTAVNANATPFDRLVIGPKQVAFYQSFLSATSSGRAVRWHEDASLPLTLLAKGGQEAYEMLGGSEREYQVLFPGDATYSDVSSPDFMYQDLKRNYRVLYDYNWFGDVFGGIKDRWKVRVSVSAYSRGPTTVLGNDQPAPLPLERPSRSGAVAAEILNQFVADQLIPSSTALQMRSAQTQSFRRIAAFSMDRLASQTFETGARYLSALARRKLTFKPFFHAYVCTFIKALNNGGLRGLLTLENQLFSDTRFVFTPGGIGGQPIPIGITNTFKERYRPNTWSVLSPYPTEDVDFSPGGAYSLYNWELFFHVPMLVANRLSKNRRFEEAMRWYHFVFNPTTNENLNSSARFWQVIPLRNTAKETLEALMMQLQNPAGDPRRKELEDAIAAWRDNPFNPHLIARTRLIAYQKNAVMKYLDNLLAWGDSLFAQDTIETINQATQLYVLAAELCGPRPQKIAARGQIEALNYAELEAKGIDAFSNATVQLETIFPFFNLQPTALGLPGAVVALNATAPSLYFCLPDNDKLLGYWDTISDRLFKIRHCQNIEGVERQLALFEPPIDPALLVRAVAAGVDISSVLADLNSPPPHYRFSYLIQKALEMCSELQSLGNSLLSVLEKKDAEALSAMRSQHETVLLGLTGVVKKLQITEAQRTREGLENTRQMSEAKYEYYKNLISIGLIDSEKEHSSKLAAARERQDDAYGVELAANLAHIVPNFNFPAFGGSFGGSNVGLALDAWARSINHIASGYTYEANRSSERASQERRLQEWGLQQGLAKSELAQIGKQLLAAELREQIAGQELTNLEQQLDNSRQVEEFFRNKYTKEELYGWMSGEVSTIYFQCYQLAYNLAKKAEHAFRWELGLPSSSFVQFGIWDSARKGLLSGEKLYLSLKQMEKAYLDQNRREYEITKHVSLMQHNPMALIRLKETGICTVDVPEVLFDLDYPGHYMRRIKSVSLTIPCVVGPYTSVNCTLTLLKSQTRVSGSAVDPITYATDSTSDNPRVVTNFAAAESVAASSGQNDSGLFELNFRDERYLPFEGSGAVSTWRIELPKDFRPFDYETISDVVLHLKYTARQGGEALRTTATDNLTNWLKDEASKPQARLFSLRHEFPTEWYRLQSVADGNGDHVQTFVLDKQRFPFVFQGHRRITVQAIELFALPKDNTSPTLALTLTSPDGQPVLLLADAKIGPLIHKKAATSVEVRQPGASGTEADWTIKVSKADVVSSLESTEDLLLLCHYSVTQS